MSPVNSWLRRSFDVSDADARLRDPDDLDTVLNDAHGKPRRIAKGSKVTLSEARVVPTGADSVAVFVHALNAAGNSLGWTSGNNLAGRMVSETFDAFAPMPSASRFGPHAAWEKGGYLGQITLIAIMGAQQQIRYVSEATADNLLALVAAARGDGVTIGINSGFRTYGRQKELYEGFKARRPGFNPANQPGHSNHQNGIAIDFSVGGGGGNPALAWLQRRGTEFGFLRTVKSENWHWEFLPDRAAAARKRGAHSTWG